MRCTILLKDEEIFVFRVDIEERIYLEIRMCSEKQRLKNTEKALRQKGRSKPGIDFDISNELNRFRNPA